MAAPRSLPSFSVIFSDLRYQRSTAAKSRCPSAMLPSWCHMADGETLPIAGGMHVVHIPGHCAGQVAFLWQGERLLIAGDVGMNILGIGDPVGF
jgi:glyoxylase-like metal-dependent hydrolase (beta-lactamase superfamily II)